MALSALCRNRGGRKSYEPIQTLQRLVCPPLTDVSSFELGKYERMLTNQPHKTPRATAYLSDIAGLDCHTDTNHVAVLSTINDAVLPRLFGTRAPASTVGEWAELLRVHVHQLAGMFTFVTVLSGPAGTDPFPVFGSISQIRGKPTRVMIRETVRTGMPVRQEISVVASWSFLAR